MQRETGLTAVLFLKPPQIENMKHITKSVHAAFVDQIKQDFAAAGITPMADRSGQQQYTVDTVAGPYLCHANEPVPGSRLLFLTVFGRFADPEKARRHVDCNPYSGKWNFHPGDRETEQEARETASDIVRRILNLTV
jgi:hypothetical protein